MKTTIQAAIIQIVFILSSLQFMYGQTSWIQIDWSDQQYYSTENVDPDVSPGELLLINDPSNMVFSFINTGWFISSQLLSY